MFRAKSFIIPAALAGCLVIAWIGSIAANAFPTASLDQSLTEAVTAKAKVPTSTPESAPGENASCSLGSAYPASIRQWCGLIEKYARQEGLEPGLVAAVMLQESGGDPQAYSASGAVGLLQVMPSDGLASSFQCPAGPCFANRPSTAALMNPEFNISYGTAMLAGLKNKYGDLRDALKAYGPEDVGYTYADRIIQIWYNYQ